MMTVKKLIALLQKIPQNYIIEIPLRYKMSCPMKRDFISFEKKCGLLDVKMTNNNMCQLLIEPKKLSYETLESGVNRSPTNIAMFIPREEDLDKLIET